MVKKADENSILGDKSDSIVEGLGYVAGMTAIGIATGGTGLATAATTATTFTSAMGQGMTQAYQEGANNDDAWKFGVISGLAEAGSELLFGGLGKTSGAIGLSKGITAIDDTLAKKVSGVFKTTLGKNLSEYVIKAGAEGTEEVISGFFQALGQKLTYKSDEDMKKLIKDQNLLEQFVSGAITSVIAQVPGQNGIYKTTKNGKDFITGLTQNEAKVYDKELSTRADEKIKNNAIEKAYNEQIKVHEKLGIELSNEDKNTIRQAVEEAYNSGRIKPDEKMSSKVYSELEENVRKDLEDGNISIDTIRNTIGENQDIRQDKLLQKSLYEEEQKNVTYQVQKTDNEKANILYQSAADAGMNNNNITRRKIELVAKLTQDTNRQYKFVSPEQLKEMGYNENANGLINKDTGEILINSRSENGLQAIVGHETTHIFDSTDKNGEYTQEYKDLQNYVIEYAKEKGIYEDKVKKISKAYGNLLKNEKQVNEELTADLIGDFLFNDEKFIENLSTKNRNVFQKIYDYIKHALKLATIRSKESRQLENIKYQLDKVYKNIQEETNNDIKYSTGGIKGIKKIKDEQTRNEANYNYEIAKKMAKKHKSNEEIFNKTGWFQDKVTKEMKFVFSDRDMELYDKNYIIGKEYKLKEIMKHDTLFEMYPELKDYTVVIEDMNKNKDGKRTKGGYNRYTDIIKLDYSRFNNKEDVEGTLIHEVQHAIQKIENFARGASTEWGKEFYKNSPGEMEARETTTRMKIEKKYNKDLSNILPRYAKKNISAIDKMKIGLYNYLKDLKYGGVNNDIETTNQENNEKDSGQNETFSLDGYVGNIENSNVSSFSLTNNKITGDDIAVKDLLVRENSKKSNTIDEFVGKNQENIELTEKTTNENTLETNLKTKARNYISRSKTKFKNDVVAKFGTSKIANTNLLNSTVENIQKDIIDNGKLNQEQINNYFDKLYDNLKKIDTAYYDEYKDVKKDIQSTKFYVPDNVKNSISDYNIFRQNNMGNMILTNNPENIDIDSKYKELSELYPELFPNDITHQSEQIQKIAEVSKDITKVETNVSAYNDKYMGKEYRKWAREEFGGIISNLTQDINNAIRYNEDTTPTEKISLNKEEVKNVYKLIPEAKRKYEKALAKEVLTKKDRIQVDRLVNGEIDLSELPKDSNQEGIIRLATAKSEYNSLQKSIDEYVKNIKRARIEQAEQDVGDLNRWKDKKIGFLYSRETAIRIIRDIAPKDVADNIVDKYFRSYSEVNEKKVIDSINSYNNRIKGLNIDTKQKYKIEYDGEKHKVSESALIQLLGEKKISTQEIREAGADANKIENAVDTFREIYNELIEKINDSMLDNGYAPMEYRKDYFPHFTDETSDTLLGKAAKLLNINISSKDNLPTNISGKTPNFKPGRTWFSNMLQRTGNVTDYDVLKGFDRYIRGALDLIYHTNDIQNLRALEDVVRKTYDDTEIQNRIEEINESTTMNDLEKSEAIQKIYDNAKDKSHLSKFIEWLDNYTNLLAGKKAINDRGLEKELNREMYSTMQSVESRFAANAIGGNVGVALTNFAPLAQATGEIKTSNIIAGIWQTMNASIKGDNSFASTSQFITRRRGTEFLSQTTTDKITNLLTKPLEFADNFTSEAIVRAKYIQNIQEGMTEQTALEEADRYAASLMADRGRGALPTQFNNKNPIAKMINMFQVEVNNQWSYYFKDLPKNVQENGKNNLVGAYTKIMIGSYLMNELLGSIRGNSTRVLPDPLYIIKEFIKRLTDDDDDNDAETIKSTLGEILGNVPFASLPATVFGEKLLGSNDIGKIPLVGMVPNISNVIDGKTTLGSEVINTLGSSLVLPFGGAQLKKTIKGLDLYSSDKPVAGSYTNSGDLRYTVDKDVGSIVKSALFGAYANPYAQDYIDSGYKTIKSNNIDELVALDMNSTEYRQLKKDLSKAGDTSDKNGYKQYQDNKGNIYWYDSDNEIMYDSNYKKTILNEDDLTKVSKVEEQFNYINSLDLPNNQKNIIANNINKSSKKTIDMEEYSEYSSYDEYKYARDYPEKYSVVSQIGSYEDFNSYKEAIKNISNRYKEQSELATNSKQKTAISKKKKQEIQNYINSLPLNQYQKMMLEKEAGGYSIKDYKNYIYEYLESQNLSTTEKYSIWEELFD